jgi:hypothetical protein
MVGFSGVIIFHLETKALVSMCDERVIDRFIDTQITNTLLN